MFAQLLYLKNYKKRFMPKLEKGEAEKAEKKELRQKRCSTCCTMNDIEALFCKKCGTSFNKVTRFLTWIERRI